MLTKDKLRDEIIKTIEKDGEICLNGIVNICRHYHAKWRGDHSISLKGYPNAVVVHDVSDLIIDAMRDLAQDERIYLDSSWDHVAEDEPYFDMPRADFLVHYDRPYWYPSVMRMHSNE